MFHRDMIVKFLRDQGVSAEEIVLVTGRLAKHDHDSSGLLSTVCLADVFLNQELQDAFIAEWNANPTSFIDVIESGGVT